MDSGEEEEEEAAFSTTESHSHDCFFPVKLFSVAWGGEVKQKSRSSGHKYRTIILRTWEKKFAAVRKNIAVKMAPFFARKKGRWWFCLPRSNQCFHLTKDQMSGATQFKRLRAFLWKGLCAFLVAINRLLLSYEFQSNSFMVL